MIPTGYSFNLDGTCIYLTMAAIFLAQATNTELTLWQQLGIIGVLLLTSKGAAGVTGVGLHRPGSDAVVRRDDPGGEHCADPRCRSLHVGGPRADQSGRQRRRDGRRCQMGRTRSTRIACAGRSITRRNSKPRTRRPQWGHPTRCCRRQQPEDKHWGETMQIHLLTRTAAIAITLHLLVTCVGRRTLLARSPHNRYRLARRHLLRIWRRASPRS